MPSSPRNPAGRPTRRQVLGVAAGLGAGTALTACGSADEEPAAGGTAGSSSPEQTATETRSTLVATSEVPVGAGVVLEAEKVVVAQPTAGTFKAFTAVCTHKGCTVGSVKDGVISCPCHGSAFSATDGTVKNGPATQPLREIPVTVEGDQVVRA